MKRKRNPVIPIPDVFPVIIESKKLTVRKGDMSPERWEIDFGVIPAPKGGYFDGPPYSACVLTEVRLDFDPPALAKDCGALMEAYEFGLHLNGDKTILPGPGYEIASVYAMAPSLKPSEPKYTIALKPGDHLTGSVAGVPFQASADFTFHFTLLGLAADSVPSTESSKQSQGAQSSEPASTTGTQTKGE